ncbi:transposase [Sulfobacillus thermosulfidooxidans]|uniref:transposase n=1 Tax=Sulfobacillus thermosulfidooxidans TaxID=28034 RepID=UPI00068799D3|nr:transposase [Sulfobacillus thermosulfidooxidans]
MDMWRPYKEAVQRVLPHATIVIDKVPVLKMANAAMERARKSLRESLTRAQRRGLMHDRFVLLQREANLSAKDALLLSLWVKKYPIMGPIMGQAHHMKEEFFAIYDATTRHQAQQRFDAWEQALSADIRGFFTEVVTAWRHWEPQILVYFDHPVTNAYTESLNHLIRVVDRLGRGYRFEALRAKMLFTEEAFKRSRKPPKFQRLQKSNTLEEAMPALFPRRPTQSVMQDILTAPEHAVNYGVDREALSRLMADR